MNNLQRLENIKKLLLYKKFEHADIIDNLEKCLGIDENDNKENKIKLYYNALNSLIELSEHYGFEGNIWHTYLTLTLVNNENAFSTASEIVGCADGTINKIALNDFKIFKSLFEFDFNELDLLFESDLSQIIMNYKNASVSGKEFNQRIRNRICSLAIKLSNASDENEFLDIMVGFYKDFGVGKLGLHKAFRVEHSNENGTDEVKIVPITKIQHVHLDDIVGYDIPKQKLIENTEAFINGKKANNCLLFGDAGTGKSTSIKAILNEYYDRGLRMIEIYKHQFKDLNAVIAQIKNRNYKFIIYMDDLSFEEFEIEYKYLKAVIEGGLEKKPDNVLIYATSNRRHLIREKFSDKEERRDDLHSSDTVQEKLSLSYRFGVSIFFIAPDKQEYMNIVQELARRNNIDMPQDELFLEANKWELSHGGLSGRTAQQFIDNLLGKQ